jgi:hypothetical protein
MKSVDQPAPALLPGELCAGPPTGLYSEPEERTERNLRPARVAYV